jgi:hypothetical protein
MTPLQLLFPWQGTIRRLELGEQWWHRLAVVVFVTVLGVVLLRTLDEMTMSTAPVNAELNLRNGFYCWYVDGAGNKVDLSPLPSNETAVRLVPSVDTFPVHVFIHMPDGDVKEFVGKTEEEIRATWDAALHKLNVRRWLSIPAVTILVTLAMSYLLQLLYRVLLYVVYGSQKRVAN